MKRIPFIVGIATVSVACLSIAAAADTGFNNVSPKVFDPFQTELVNSSWVGGIGCPTDATVRLFNPLPPFELLPPSLYSDPACGPALLGGPPVPSLVGGDPRDKNNEGLLMAKTGPTANDASAVAVLDGVKGMVITELGYDIRKPGVDLSAGIRGSHCGAGAPRFSITLQDGESFVIGCNSPPAPIQKPGIGWVRLRWGVAGLPLQGFGASGLQTIPMTPVESISIIFDEGQDTGGPDNFGLAVLDNIDVNGQLVGRGGRASN